MNDMKDCDHRLIVRPTVTTDAITGECLYCAKKNVKVNADHYAQGAGTVYCLPIYYLKPEFRRREQ